MVDRLRSSRSGSMGFRNIACDASGKECRRFSGRLSNLAAPPAGINLGAGHPVARRPRPSAMSETTRVFKLTPSFPALAASLA